jgi:hypothetical protein
MTKENCHLMSNKKKENNMSKDFVRYVILRAISFVKTVFQFSDVQPKTHLTGKSPCGSGSEVFTERKCKLDVFRRLLSSGL